MIGEKMRKKIKYFDWPLFFAILILIGLGTLGIFSLTQTPEKPISGLFINQIIYFFLGLVIFFIVSFQDYSIYKKIPFWLYSLSIFLLILSFLWAKIFHLQVARWIDLGIFQFQPSEFVKVFLLIFLAWYFSEKSFLQKDFKTLIFSILLVFLPFLMTAAQPDLGTSLVFLVIWGIMILFSPVNKKYLIFLFLVFVFFLPIGWNFLKDYQKERILVFIDPNRDPLGTGYHVLQSIIAIGSGGLWGKGIGQGIQSQLQFLPAPYTDFIFAALAEELGFIGVVFLLGTFFVLFLRIVNIIKKSKDSFGRFLALGVLAVLLFQMLVNVGMNMGIMPVTGIPLPLISYGGSALITTLWLLGIVESISIHHKKIKF
jgi:rod shape determining protein RodA